MGDFFTQLQQEAGNQPQASPDDFKSPEERTGAVQKASSNVEDTLAGGLAVANTHLEQILDSGDEVPDEALPELQRMGQLMMDIFQSQSPQAAGAGAPPPQQVGQPGAAGPGGPAPF